MRKRKPFYYIMEIFRKFIGRIKLARDWFFLRVNTQCEILSQIYYSFFNFAFIREHAAVLSGRKAYMQALTNRTESSVLLRRNIHRLEKGLIMRPRRPSFAAEYITETVNAYCISAKEASGREDSNADEIDWAYDVLTAYFDAVDASSPVIEQARKNFADAPSRQTRAVKRKPYCRDLSQAPPVAYDDLLALSKLRRSVRWYQQKPVPRELVDRAVKVAAFSPSACNRQPFHFRIYDNREKIKKVASIPMGTAGFNHNFPGLIVVVGRLDAYFDERDRHVIYIDASLAAMALIYALEAQGVSSCAINWPDIRALEKKMSEELNLKPYERAILLISYGYPDPQGMVPYSQKKPLGQLRSYNR